MEKIRSRFYETFRAIHLVLSIVLLVALICIEHEY